MGSTNEIKETNISLQLEGKNCPQCQQPFTQQEIDDRNFDIWFDTTNDVRLTPMEDLKDDNYYKPFSRTGYELTIWIRSIEHEYCPEVPPNPETEEEKEPEEVSKEAIKTSHGK